MIEFWRAGGPGSLRPSCAAAAVEAQGWDGQMFMDSQSLSADPYVLMGHWAAVTERIKLSTGVTNPMTRHPAVTAASAATLQATSGGRYVLGIGRGDSALAYLGYAPTPLARFERSLADLQTLLSGGRIPFTSPLPDLDAAVLPLGDRPDKAGLEWLPPGLPKVPLDVAASGPRVIAMAARVAERVTFSVGADPDRLNWAVGCATRARLDGPVRHEDISYGAQVVVVCHANVDRVKDVATRLVMPLARFQVINSATAAGPKQAGDDEQYASIATGYAMTKHDRFDGDKLVNGSIDFEFVRRFAIVGPPAHCIDRLIHLSANGVDRFVIFGPGHYDDGTDGGTLFTDEVMPAVRSGVTSQRRAWDSCGRAR